MTFQNYQVIQCCMTSERGADVTARPNGSLPIGPKGSWRRFQIIDLSVISCLKRQEIQCPFSSVLGCGRSRSKEFVARAAWSWEKYFSLSIRSFVKGVLRYSSSCPVPDSSLST